MGMTADWPCLQPAWRFSRYEGGQPCKACKVRGGESFTGGEATWRCGGCVVSAPELTSFWKKLMSAMMLARACDSMIFSIALCNTHSQCSP